MDTVRSETSDWAWKDLMEVGPSSCTRINMVGYRDKLVRLGRAWWGWEIRRKRNVQHKTAVNDSTVSILQVATNLKIVSGIEVGGTGGQIQWDCGYQGG